MAYSVQMPALGESVTEGTITRWLKQEGDHVDVDEPLLEVSTDKVDTEIPSPQAGVLQRIVAQEDDTVEVGGELLGRLVAEDDLDRALGAHDGDLGRGPGVVDVAAQVFAAHHVIGAAIGLARDHRDLGHGRLAIGEEQLGAVLDDAVMLLRRAGQEAGHVDEGEDRDVERVAEAHEPRGLLRGGDVQGAGELHRLVRDDAHAHAVQAGQAGDHVGRVQLLQLQQVALVHDRGDDRPDRPELRALH